MRKDNERYFESFKDAYEASKALRVMAAEEGMLIKVERSPYGGYRLCSYPIDEENDLMVEFFALSNRKQGYLK